MGPARILTRWPQPKVAAARLVAPADPAVSRRLAAFVGLPDQPLGVPATVGARRDDPWMAFSQSAALAEALQDDPAPRADVLAPRAGRAAERRAIAGRRRSATHGAPAIPR